MSQMSRLETIVVILVLAVSLGPRVVGLDTFLVDDEVRWTRRSISFRDALARGDWANTFRTGHPGVVTTWLGAIFIPPADSQAKTVCQTSGDASELGQVDLTPTEKTQAMVSLGQILFKGRLGPVLFTWICMVAIYFLVRLLWGTKIAMLSLVLMALDPFSLALSRFLHLDAVLTGLMTISVLSMLVSVDHPRSDTPRWVFLMLSGGAGGLAILQKSPAGFLLPFVALLLAIGSSDHPPDLAELGLAHRLERDLVSQLRLLGYELEHEALLAGQDISLRLVWQALEVVPQDYRLQLELLGADGTVYGQSVLDLISTDYATSRWQPEEILHDWYTLPTVEEMPTGEASLLLNLLDEQGQPVLAQPVEVGRVWIQSTRPSFETPQDITPHEVDLGGKITLLGYDLDSEPVEPGENVHVILYWQARQATEAVTRSLYICTIRMETWWRSKTRCLG